MKTNHEGSTTLINRAELLDNCEDAFMMQLERFEAETAYRAIADSDPDHPFVRTFLERWKRESTSWVGFLSPQVSNARQCGYALASNWVFSTLSERLGQTNIATANIKCIESLVIEQIQPLMESLPDFEDEFMSGFRDGLKETWIPIWRRIHDLIIRNQAPPRAVSEHL